MADVLPLNVWLALAALTRTPRIWQQADYNEWAAVAWIGVCIVTATRKTGVWVLAAAVLVVQVGVEANAGTLAVGWIALAVGLFQGQDLMVALRVLTVTIYLFAAAHKSFHPFMSGAALYHFWLVPFPALVAPLAVFTEATVGVLVWMRSRFALWAAIPLHAGIVLLIRPDWDATLPWALSMIPIAGFNLVMVGLVWLLFNSDRTRRPAGIRRQPT